MWNKIKGTLKWMIALIYVEVSAVIAFKYFIYEQHDKSVNDQEVQLTKWIRKILKQQ